MPVPKETNSHSEEIACNVINLKIINFVLKMRRDEQGLLFQIMLAHFVANMANKQMHIGSRVGNEMTECVCDYKRRRKS